MKNFMLNLFDKILLKKDKIYSSYSRRLRIPRNFKISPFKVEKLAAAEKNNHQLFLEEKVSDMRDKISYIIIFNFPKLFCSTVL